MRMSISTKLIAVTTIILLAGIFPIVIKSTEALTKTTSQVMDFTNLEMATNKANEVDRVLSTFIDKAQFLGSQLLKAQLTQSQDLEKEIEQNFTKSKDFVAIEVFKIENGLPTSVLKKIKLEEIKMYGKDDKYIHAVHSWQKFPILKIAEGKDGQVLFKNGTFPTGPALFTVGFPLAKDPVTQNVSHVALVDISLTPLLKPFSDPQKSIYLLDLSGDVFAYKDDKIIFARKNLKSHPFVQEAINPNNKKNDFQKTFEDPKTKENFFGSAAKNQYGFVVFSEMSKDIVLKAAKDVRDKSILISGVSLSAAIFIIFLVSLSLSAPIGKLAELVKQVKGGNFDIHARQHVKSKDEVGDLAVAFDEMTVGLKERDKVKNLFNKFHGSSVAEELLQKEISLGGQRKDVVIFFSDIRGFTSYSESRSPEEVVEMLNEYFTEMVGIIGRHHGVVDKFIGDAIMAVWGAPKSTGNDAADALKACIEMRRSLDKLNERRISRGQEPIQIGMGLHTGSAISGNIGSNERVEYTVIGNTVNTASRIEASTKAFGADLLISEELKEKVGPAFLVELAGSAEVKGRSDALKLYKVRGYVDEHGVSIEVKTPYSDYQAEKADKVKVA